MTRETKIGLLVGLAFIIVIGILLSDHLTQSTEPPQATLAVAGSSVRSTVNTPGSSTANPPITTVVTPPPQVAPPQPVPTVSEVTNRQPPVQVDIGAPATNGNANANAQQSQQSPPVARSGQQQTAPESSAPPAPSQPEQVAAGDPPPTAPPPLEVATNTGSHSQPTVPSALREAARQNNEELVPAGGGNTATSNSSRTSTAPPTTPRTTVTSSNPSPSNASPTSAGVTRYTAAEGDTVSKMASRFLGANTKENRDLIVAANPSLQANPNKIIVGRSYNIPKPGTSIAQVTSPSPSASPPSASRSSTPTSNSGEIWYTIKEGDTLSRIAQEQCGTVGAVQAIIELNPETLSDPNNIVVNTKIRLPSKQVATAN